MSLDKRIHAYGEDWADVRLKGSVEAARYVEGRRANVRVPIADLRRRPASDAPLETQALFGEAVLIFQTGDEGWSLVQLEADSYVGFMPTEALGPATGDLPFKVRVPRTFVFPAPDIKAPPLDALPMGARVAIIGEASDHNADYRLVAPFGAVVAQHLSPSSELAPDFVAVAERFLGAPYLWGGKSVLGIDCTGLTQMALAMAGIAAPRDSDMQEAWAIETDPSAPRQRGDLVFWKGHVGIMLDEARLLHANAHHMMTAIEPLDEAVARIGARGSPVTSVRRAPAHFRQAA